MRKLLHSEAVANRFYLFSFFVEIFYTLGFGSFKLNVTEHGCYLEQRS